MNITILGGCGFIGSHLSELLLQGGHNLTIFDHPNAGINNIEHIKEQINLIRGDFLIADDLVPAIQDADVVVHLISSTLPANSLSNPIYDLEANVIPSIRLFQKCVEYRVRKVVYISSGGTVYGIPQKLPIQEDHPLNPITPYGLSKQIVEKYLGLFSHHHELDYSILRLSNPYGDKQNPHTGQGVIATWMHRISLGEAIEIWGDGEVVRDYIYIKDAVEAIKLAILTSADEKVFNVGSGKGYSLNQIQKLLESSLNKNFPVIHKESRVIDVPVNILEVSRIRNILGWQAKTSLEDGIKLTWAHSFISENSEEFEINCD